MQDILRRLLETPPVCNDSLLTVECKSSPVTAAASVPAASDSCNFDSRTCQGGVTVISADSLTYSDFLNLYMALNLPVLIKGACRGWPCFSHWSTDDGGVNMKHLTAIAGHCEVAVTDTARHHQGCGPCTTMTFEQFSNWWNQRHDCAEDQRHKCINHQQQQQQQQPHGSHQSPLGCSSPCWYMKDWHFVAEFPEQQVYKTPKYFQEDWLNEYLDEKITRQRQQQRPCAGAAQNCCCGDDAVSNGHPAVDGSSGSSRSGVVTSDYRFVYCGPSGSWTPVHSDVLRSYSWSANVVGRKRWWLLPPQHTHLLQDKHGQISTDFFTTEPQEDNRQQQWQQHLLEVEQGVGDALFVPSGWFHMVVNEVDTLSINHNWVNGHNIHWSWRLLRHEHHLATQQLEDCRETASADEFEGLVQKMLAANSGFDFEQLADLLSTIITRRLAVVQQLQHQQQQMFEPPVHTTDSQQLHQQSSFMTAAVVSAPELEKCSIADRIQTQLLHCALDLKRAADVLQEVQQAYVAVLEHNQAWCSSKMDKNGQGERGGYSVLTRTGSQAQQQMGSQSGSLQLPTWVKQAEVVVAEARQVVETLTG